MKHVMVLGSTGSIGRQTLDVIRQNDDLDVVSLAAGSNIDLLEEQIREFNPELVCVYSEEKATALRRRLRTNQVKVMTGMEGLITSATLPQGDLLVAAVVGMIGIRPIIEAVKRRKDIALANKETLVTAGHIIMPLAEKMDVKILPVDSEHSAVFQCINGENCSEIEKIILTASGGPFFGKSRAELEKVTLEDTLNHPNWSMGRKITVDSATMVNKGLEVIEAKWLFGVDYEKIQVIVQPQSIIHSMVEFQDGAILAQLGTPDMHLPIQYALCDRKRKGRYGEPLDFTRLSEITFGQPDMETFRGLALAIEAGKIGGSMPTVMNAANERAVELFLQKKISFLTIADIIEEAMQRHTVIKNPEFDAISAIEQEVLAKINETYQGSY